MSETPIAKMGFKQLRIEVQSLRDELARIKRSYEDILYNLDYDNFSGALIKEKDGMKTSITQTAEKIELQAVDISTNATNIAALTVTAGDITAKVESNYKDLDGKYSSLSTQITQTADRIETNVEAVFNKIVQVSSTFEMTDKDTIYCLNGRNYYYSSIIEDWKSIEGNSIASAFVQTGAGFSLSGDVSISGDLITSGTITGTNIKTNATTAGQGVVMNAEANSLDFYNQGTLAAQIKCVETGMAPSTAIMPVGGRLVIGNSATTYEVLPSGIWDFSGANVININPKFA